MKARIYLSLGALLLFLAPLGCSDKAENTSPETLPEPEKPEFVDANRPMEETMHLEDEYGGYSYFRFQNAGKDTITIHISTKMSADPGVMLIRPGEQGTWLQSMEKLPWIDDNDVLIKNLDALGFVRLYFNVPPITEDNYHAITPDVDTCAEYSFFDPMTEAQRGTPRDQSAWVFEEFPDRPNAVRWTYRITEREYEEAVRQTLERWAEKDDEEQE